MHGLKLETQLGRYLEKGNPMNLDKIGNLLSTQLVNNVEVPNPDGTASMPDDLADVVRLLFQPILKSAKVATPLTTEQLKTVNGDTIDDGTFGFLQIAMAGPGNKEKMRNILLAAKAKVAEVFDQLLKALGLNGPQIETFSTGNRPG